MPEGLKGKTPVPLTQRRLPCRKVSSCANLGIFVAATAACRIINVAALGSTRRRCVPLRQFRSPIAEESVTLSLADTVIGCVLLGAKRIANSAMLLRDQSRLVIFYLSGADRKRGGFIRAKSRRLLPENKFDRSTSHARANLRGLTAISSDGDSNTTTN